MTEGSIVRRFLKSVITGGIVLAMLLSLSFSVSAIGFDAEEKYDSVFIIESGNSLGSGFSFGENGIITNAHVISNKNRIVVEGYDGSRMNAELIFMDSAADIALIAVPDKTFTPILPADLKALQVGSDVYAIGAPRSMAYTLTKGIVSSKNRTYRGANYIQTDAAINHGNSGGPLLDSSGRVVGVNSMKISDAEGIGLAISIDDVTAFLKEHDVPLDENGNISQKLSADDPAPQENPAEASEGTVRTVTKTVENPVNIILVIALAVSAVLNIVLIIVIIRKKKKKPTPKFDPSERTDFEIDILE